MGFSLDVNLCALTHAGPIQLESCKGVESYKVFARPIQSFTELRFVRVTANNELPVSVAAERDGDGYTTTAAR